MEERNLSFSSSFAFPLPGLFSLALALAFDIVGPVVGKMAFSLERVTLFHTAMGRQGRARAALRVAIEI
jgi:hypothetical protein